MSLVTLQTQFGVGTITLNRPEAANAMSISLLQALSEILQMVSQRQDIYVVILTASGDKAFCAGADLKERKGMTEQEVKRAVRLIGATVNQVEQLPQPVIAAINGVAFGGGLELALACDIRVASEQAKMGLTETSLAIIPGAGGTQRLPRLIGIAKAKEYIYTARRLTAQQALQAGIVTHLFSDVYQGAQQIAKEIAKQGPLALQQAKKAMNTGSEVDLQTGLAVEALAYDALIPTRDRLEGLQAFAEKRTPHYKGE